MIKKTSLTLILLFLALFSVYGVLNTDFCKADSWEHLRQEDNTATELLRTLDKKKSEAGEHPFYQGTPKESQYSDKGLTTQSQLRSQTDPVSKMIFETSNERKQFKIDVETDPLVVGAQKITEGALEHIGGKGTKSIQTIHGHKDEKILCEEGGEESLETCKNTLHVEVKKTTLTKEKQVSFNISGCKKSYKSWPPKSCESLANTLVHHLRQVSSKRKNLIIPLPLNVTIAYKECLNEARTHKDTSCKKCKDPRNSLDTSIDESKIKRVTIPRGSSGNYLISGSSRTCSHGHLKGYDLAATAILTYEEESYEILPDEWTSTCPRLEEKSDQGLCHYVTKECTQGPQTRKIKGIPVTRDCWEETYTYSCAYPSKNDCGPLRARGCAQIASSCKKKVGSSCVVFSQTYQCKGGSKTAHSITGGKTPFCLDGNCRDQGWELNDEMMSTLAQLSVLKELQGQFQSGGFFKGEKHKCSKQITSFKDCCGSAKGWGKDLGFAKCSSEEKLLNQKRKKSLCHFVGTYCSKKILGKCVTKKSSYCCFGSKLLKAFHEQGRPQIGLGWGKAKKPQCRGFTIEEIQKIDFSKLDLSEVFEDLMKSYNPEKLKGTTDTLKHRLETIQKGMQPPKMKQQIQRKEA